MKFARLVLAASATPFILTGLAFLVAPVQTASLVNLSIESPTVDSMVRTAFGGLQIGCGVFLAITALRPAWVRPGLAAHMALWGGPVIGRLASWYATGSAPPPILLLIICEIAFVVLGAFAWRRLLQSTSQAAA